jgi:predicted GTPase
LKILKIFVKEFNDINNQEIKYADNITDKIKYVKNELTKNEFYPSLTLINVLNKLSIRANEPMKVAITGQFSSGKSTFLNALISKEILPTGITPVTSKVNFIKYGDEYKLEIHYDDGRIEFHPVEALKDFTDQRQNTKDIKYLTLYVPYDTLKDITFVDTPGLNSQSVDDTKTTMNVLKDVDGIIWLTLIDNAGKLSEQKALAMLLKNSNIKSLCVLNQKDRFCDSEIEKTSNYIKEKFSDFFDEVIPISAKLALKARKNDKHQMIQENIDKLSLIFKKELQKKIYGDISFFSDKYEEFKNKIDEILDLDFSQNIKLLEDSNINKVIDFIENDIRPHANKAKETSIKNDLLGICDILIEQYKIIITVFDKLSQILQKYHKNLDEFFKIPKLRYAKELNIAYSELEKIILLISSEIYSNLNSSTKYRYHETKGSLLSKSHIEKIPYEMPWFDSENIYKNLFYDDEKVEKLLKKVIRDLKNSEQNAKNDIISLYEKLELDIKSWQHLYEYTSKNREISSDKEFANLRRFVGGVYEKILKDFNDTNLKSIAKLEYDFGYIQGALEFNYQNATKTTVAFFKRRIYESITFFEEDPLNFKIYKPSDKEITEQIKIHFSFNKLDTLIKSKRNFLYKNIEELQQNFESLSIQKEKFIQDKQEMYLKKIDKIKNIMQKLSEK